MSDATLEHAKEVLASLSPAEKAEIVAWLGTTLKAEIMLPTGVPRRSMYGLCADLGSAPSDEDIEEVRREIWANFPREDIS